MLRSVIVLCLVLTTCNICDGFGASLVGGYEEMSEAEFKKSPTRIATINQRLDETYTSNSVYHLSFLQFKCASKQVVAGLNIDVHYLACEMGEHGVCISNEKPKKCIANIYEVPWMIRDESLNRVHVSCGPEVEDIWNNCSKPRPKRDLSENKFGETLVMEKPTIYDGDVKALFDRFLATHNREYSQDSTTKAYQERYEIFKKNYEIVNELNKMDQGTAIYGITEFMDYSADEYRRYLAPGFTKPLVDIRKVDLAELDAQNIPESVDWRKQGAVTAVKNQGQCGSCWAFSTTGNIEGQWFIKKKKLISLSEQELVDCDTLDQGCGGGLPSNAYKSIEKLGGLETESEYPYEGDGEKCNLNAKDIKVYINDSIALPKDEGKLAAWLAKNGPISIGINANMMQFYFGGISHPWKIFCNPSSLDHGVLIVGYGTENGTPFWIIKNSWGASWGENGYYRIYRGDGSCGVNQMATSSIVD